LTGANFQTTVCVKVTRNSADPLFLQITHLSHTAQTNEFANEISLHV